MEWQRYLASQGRARGGYRGYSPVPRPYVPRPAYQAVPRGPTTAYQPRRPIQPAAAVPAVRAVAARPYQPPVRRASPVAYQPRPGVQVPYAKGGSYRVPQRATDIAHLYEQVERRLPEVCHRYPKLAVSPDFSLLAHHWPNEGLDVPLDVTIPFHTDPDFTLPVPDAEPEIPEGQPK
eukprot:EG_transcript_35535